MLKERDDIDRLIYDKLHDVELAPPTDGWSRLEQSVYGRKKRVLWWPYATAAAAAVLLLLMMTLKLEVNNEEVLADTEVVEPPIQWKEPQVAQPEPETTEPSANGEISIASSVERGVGRTVAVATPVGKRVETRPDIRVETPVELPPSQEHPVENATQELNTQEPSRKQQENFDLDAYARSVENETLPVAAKTEPKKRSWNLGVYAGNQGGTTSAATQSANGLTSDPMASSVLKGVTLFQVADLRKGEVQPVKFKHNMPLSVGVTARKYFSNRFAVETGITYSYLSSSGKVEGQYGYTLHQYLHYLGIPVTANYSFVTYKGFSFYGAAGGAIERCIASERKAVYTNDDGSTRTVSTGMEVTDIDLSLTAKLGVSYDLGKYVGISFEPLLNYYFMGSEKVDSYRKENPFGFSLRLGVYARF